MEHVHAAVRGRLLLVGRSLLGLLVVIGVSTVAVGVWSDAAGATDASAGACIKAHPPSVSVVGPTSATVNVEYNDDCVFPAKVGVKLYRPSAPFLREATKTSESTHGSWKTASFTFTDLPTDKLFRLESSVENFGTDFSSYVEFETAFKHPTSFTLEARGVRGTPHESNQVVVLDITAGGLTELPAGTTLVTIGASVDGRPLDSAVASFHQCALQSLRCEWSYRIEGVPWGAKLTLTATFNNTTYADGFPNQQTTKAIRVVGGDSKTCRATTSKSDCPG